VILPLCKVDLPASAAKFYNTIFQIAAFDIYDLGDIIDSLLDLEETDPLTESFEKIGFESRGFLHNMGTMIFFYVLYPFLILVHKISMKFRNCSRCCRKTQSKLRGLLYYNWLIATIFESYAIIALCCLIQLPVMSFETYGLSVQGLLAIMFSLLIMTVPFIMLRHAVRNFHALETDVMKRKYGALYEDLKLAQGKMVFLQPGFFLVRRLMLAIAVVVAYDTLIVQIFIIMGQSIIAVIIANYTRPFKSAR